MAPTQTPQLLENLPKAGVQYILHFRQGSNPYPLFTFFFFSSTDMKKVVERAKRHCEVMGHRFVSVRPAVTDLDQAENFLNDR